ncbi:preprotein translocase subunit SecG [Candidatus Peregrinibacteria bacterium]|nr:preprotein translocase subunit SecG [Candidatus Peregrinibacteria bacterium]
MDKIILIVQVVISILLSIFILMQNKDGGLSAMMGGGSEGFQTTKRGPEKFIYITTIVLATLFILNALLIVII